MPVTWYLSGVTLSDGGRAFGSFVYDAATGVHSHVNIVTTPGVATTTGTGLLAGKNYTQPISAFSAPTQLLAASAVPAVPNETGYFALVTFAPLTDNGGSLTLSPSTIAEAACANSTCTTFNAGVFRTITGGRVIATTNTAAKIWYLNNIKFDDGGQAEGSFVFDASSGLFSNVDVWVTGGAAFANRVHYVAAKGATTFQAGASLVALVTANPAQTGDRMFLGVLSAPMTNAGGTILPTPGATGAREFTCLALDCTAVGGARLVVSGQITTVKPADYNRILSDIVDGGNFQTTIIASNMSAVAGSFSISFFQDNGAPFNVPGIGTSTAVTVPARGTATLVTTGTGTLQQGWARLDGADDFNVIAVFRLKNANAAGDVENSVFGEPLGATVVSFPFDNTNGAVGGLALTNSNQAIGVTVLAVAYDEVGNVLTNNTNITLPAGGHTAFNFQNQNGYITMAGKKGILRLFAIPNGDAPVPFNGLNGLLLKFLPNLTNTTVQAIHQ